jgi:hypothetical protein
VVCIAVLLVASTVEAAHFCELGGATTAVQATSARNSSSSPAFCLICATAHQASMGASVAHLARTEAVIASAVVAAVQSQSRLRTFTMDVRPPPALS